MQTAKNALTKTPGLSLHLLMSILELFLGWQKDFVSAIVTRTETGNGLVKNKIIKENLWKRNYFGKQE